MAIRLVYKKHKSIIYLFSLLLLYAMASYTETDKICRITAYNMKTFRTGQEYLSSEVAEISDIICISEHGLYECEFYKFDDLLPDLRQSADLNQFTQYSQVCGHCGVGILWRRSLNNLVTPLKNINHDRICGIKLQTVGDPWFIFSVYLPQINCKIADYVDVVLHLEMCVERVRGEGNILIIGDMNAHFGVEYEPRGWGITTRNGKTLNDFIRRLNMTCIDMTEQCKGPTYTFYSKVGKSYVDHCVMNIEASEYVTECRVWERCVENRSDHSPLTVCLNLSMTKDPLENVKASKRLNWGKLTDEQVFIRYTEPLSHLIDDILERYMVCVRITRQEYVIDRICIDENMSEADIEKMVAEFVNEMKVLADSTIPHVKFKKTY